jgi:hypothetical protein
LNYSLKRWEKGSIFSNFHGGQMKKGAKEMEKEEEKVL